MYLSSWSVLLDKNSINNAIGEKTPEVFYKKAVFKNFAIFTGKHLWESPFLIKLPAWSPATLLKRDSITGILLWILQNF